MLEKHQQNAEVRLEKHEVESALKLIEQLKTKAAALATRWAVARHGYGYTAYAGGIRFDIGQGKIYYSATPCTSGMQLSGAFDMKYLWNDSSLETDAKDERESVEVAQREKQAKIAAFEQSAEYREYLKLKNAQVIYPSPYGAPYGYSPNSQLYPVLLQGT